MTEHELQGWAEHQIGLLESWRWTKNHLGYLTDAGWLEALNELEEKKTALQDQIAHVKTVLTAVREVVWRNEQEDVVARMETTPGGGSQATGSRNERTEK